MKFIDDAIDAATWTKKDAPLDGVAYQGLTPAGEIVFVVAFYVADVRLYAGTYARHGTVIHLTPELAERAFKKAEAA